MHEIKQSRFDFFKNLFLGIALLLPFSSLFANKIKKNTKEQDETIPDIKFESISKEEADEIYKNLQEGYNFEAIAKQKSKCPSGEKGGNLGWFGRGQMVKEFENACFNGKKGDILPPIKTQFGYHIIRIDDTQ